MKTSAVVGAVLSDTPAGLAAYILEKFTFFTRPEFIHRTDGDLLAVAGLWATWRDRTTGPDAPWLHSCTVITTAANATMTPVHDRMPVILPASRWNEWLDPTYGDTTALKALLVPAANDILTMHAVSTDVNNARNTGPQLIEPVAV